MKRYLYIILEPLFQILTEEEKQHEYSQREKVTDHTSQHSMEVIREIFGKRLISHRNLP